MIEAKARGRRVGSKNYTPEFRAQVVAETRDPSRSIAEVAHSHGLNANLVSMWRSREMSAGEALRIPSAETFLPVQVEAPASIVEATGSSVVVECGAIRVRFEGVPDLDVLRTVLISLRAAP